MALEPLSTRQPFGDGVPAWTEQLRAPGPFASSSVTIENNAIIHELTMQYHPELSDLAVDHPRVASIRKHLLIHLEHLREAYPDFAELRGKRVLDVACGSTQGPLNHNHEFDPWMSRLLVALGASPLGIDIAPQGEERFESLQCDLTRLDALSFLTEEFDAYYVRGFPDLNAIAAFRHAGLLWDELRDNHSGHLARCLKPGGKVIRGFTAKNDAFVARVLAGELKDSPDDEL